MGMRIFDWAKDLEKVYDDLLEKAKEQNLKEIEELKKKNDISLEETHKIKQDLVTKALNSLQNDVNKEISHFAEKLEKILNEFEQVYNQNKTVLINEIIDKVGLDFSA